MSGRAGTLAWLALGIVWVVWGSTYLAIAIVVRELPPFASAGLRFLVAGAGIGLVCLLRGGPWPSRRQIADDALVGVLLLAVGNAGVMWAERTVPSGIAALIVATVPLWITLLEAFGPAKRPWSLRSFVSIAIGLSGVAVVARPEAAGGSWTGIIVLQCAAFSWTLGVLYSQGLRRRLPVLQASSIQMLAGASALVLESLVAGEDWTRFGHASPAAWAGLAYLAAFGSIVAFTAFSYALAHLSAPVVATYAYVNPVVAVALGHMVLGEALSPSLLGGAILILGAVVLTTAKGRPSLRRTATAPQAEG